MQVVRAGMEALNFEQYELSLTDADVITIVRCFPSLRSLTLCSSKNITDISMGAVATLSRLRELDINGCNITVAGISALPEKLESLKATRSSCGTCSNL